MKKKIDNEKLYQKPYTPIDYMPKLSTSDKIHGVSWIILFLLASSVFLSLFIGTGIWIVWLLWNTIKTVPLFAGLVGIIIVLLIIFAITKPPYDPSDTDGWGE